MNGFLNNNLEQRLTKKSKRQTKHALVLIVHVILMYVLIVQIEGNCKIV